MPVGYGGITLLYIIVLSLRIMNNFLKYLISRKLTKNNLSIMTDISQRIPPQ